MNLGLYILSIALLFISQSNLVDCVTEFDGESCVLAHNELRKRHVDTKDVTKSKKLENDAKEYARRLRGTDTSFPVHPTRNAPMRKRRSLEDGIDESIHLELWDGDITYPSSDDQWFANLNRNYPFKIGKSIHKHCCSRFKPTPHCPKEFFHGLTFPPPADGVVKDMYNEEEKDYNYETGKSKTIFSHVDHFARIVWKNLTEVGCGQSLPNNLGCVFTVVLYHLDEKKEMSSEENYVKNIGIPIISDQKNPTMIIVLVIILVAIIAGLIILAYCCRHNIDEKYRAAKIEIDVLKAEQELETDSTNFWWVRPLTRKQKEQKEKKKMAPVAAYASVKERPSIDVVTNAQPMKPRPSLKNIPRPSLEPTNSAAEPPVNVNQLVNRYRGISMKRQDYLQLNPPQPPARPPIFKPRPSQDEQQPRRSSGKAVPPPKPPSFRPAPPPSRPQPPKPQLEPQQSFEKPRPVPRKPPPGTRPAVPPNASPQIPPGGKRPILPPKKTLPPTPNVVEVDEDDRPMSIAERRRILEAKQAL